MDIYSKIPMLTGKEEKTLTYMHVKDPFTGSALPEDVGDSTFLLYVPLTPMFLWWSSTAWLLESERHAI